MLAKNHTQSLTDQLYIPRRSLTDKDEYVLIIKHKTFMTGSMTLQVILYWV